MCLYPCTRSYNEIASRMQPQDFNRENTAATCTLTLFSEGPVPMGFPEVATAVPVASSVVVSSPLLALPQTPFFSLSHNYNHICQP